MKASHRQLFIIALLALVMTPVCSAELPVAVRDVEAAFDNEVRLKVEAPYDGGLKVLRERYRTAIKAALKSASSMGRLDESLALKEELLHTAKGDVVPETDEPGTNSEVVRLRGIWRQEKARLDKDRDTQIKGIAAAHDGRLRQMEERLTKELKLDEAKAVRERRESLRKVVQAGAGAATPMQLVGGSGAAVGGNSDSVEAATKEKPFVNFLGMKFVPVPGTQVLFCIHETRNADYAAYAAEQSGVNAEWRAQASGGKDQHPVVKVCYEDAAGFCRWLSAKEGKTYRLPSDAEWSAAVGLKDERGATPEEKTANSNDSSDVFPWGNYFPPKPGDGNYDPSLVNDGYVQTAPVMSFRANELGIYDLGGNAWEWCQDWYNEEKEHRVLRGASWNRADRVSLHSSYRNSVQPVRRFDLDGFRCVFVVNGN